MYNSALLLRGLVDSLPDGLAGIDWQLIFVDNASTDGSTEEARHLVPGAQIIELGRNAGYAAGINAGIAAAGPATAVLALNADVRLGVGCVANLLRALRVPGTGIAVPRLTNRHGDLNPSMRREPGIGKVLLEAVAGSERLGRIWDVGEVVFDSCRYAEETTTDWAEGSMQLISRECLNACGPWDETFFLYSEETEFGLRARDAGFATRYMPSAHAVHLEGGSVDDPAKWSLVTKNKVKLYRRRHGRLAGALFYLCVLFREGSRTLLGHPTSRAACALLLSPGRMRAPAGPELLATS
jgi:GT2 family glycosyltransferase